jgi:peroxiredoxin family protein
MSGLTIIVTSGDLGRFQAALEVAAANAALGKRTRLFLQSNAVPLLRPALDADLDLLGEAIALGTSVTVCQTGLAMVGMTAEELPPGVDTGGLVELLATRRDDQLLMA